MNLWWNVINLIRENLFIRFSIQILGTYVNECLFYETIDNNALRDPLTKPLKLYELSLFVLDVDVSLFISDVNTQTRYSDNTVTYYKG